MPVKSNTERGREYRESMKADPLRCAESNIHSFAVVLILLWSCESDIHSFAVVFDFILVM